MALSNRKGVLLKVLVSLLILMLVAGVIALIGNTVLEEQRKAELLSVISEGNAAYTQVLEAESLAKTVAVSLYGIYDNKTYQQAKADLRNSLSEDVYSSYFGDKEYTSLAVAPLTCKVLWTGVEVLGREYRVKLNLQLDYTQGGTVTSTVYMTVRNGIIIAVG